MKHKTGYNVWAYGIKTWHRTHEGAIKEAIKTTRWCHNVQIIDCKTGNLVSGKPE